jgi:hypothetical protein
MTKRLGYNPLPAADSERLELAFREKDPELGRLLVASALASPDDKRVLELALQSLKFEDETLVANALEAIEHVHWFGSGRLLTIDLLNASLLNVPKQMRANEFVISNLRSLCDCLYEKGVQIDGLSPRYGVRDGLTVSAD